MIGRKKKEDAVQRNPNISRSKQSVFHYSSNRSQSERMYDRGDAPEEVEAARSKRSKRVKNLSVLSVAFVLIFVAFYFSLLFSGPKVVVAGGQPLRKDAPYAAQAADLADDSFLSRSKLTVNRSKLASELQSKFPEITGADISTPVFSPRMTISLNIAEPAAILDTGSGDYLLDNRGVALFDTDDVRLGIDEDNLVRIEDNSDADIQAGKPALTSVQMAFISEIRHQADAKELTTESINLVAGGGELAVKYGGTGYTVKYNTNEDARKSFGTYFAMREYLISKRLTPAEYVDVRIPERAYTK